MSKRLIPGSQDIIKAVALDIGKEVASRIETMYPEAVNASGSSFLLSVRNCVYNEVMMASSGTLNKDETRKRLVDRAQTRGEILAMYRRVYRNVREKSKIRD